MTAQVFFGSAVHHGYDPFKQPSGDSETINPFLLELPYSDEMTRNRDAGYGFAPQPSALDVNWTFGLPVDGQSISPTQYLGVSGSDATKSPGRHSHQQSSGRSEDTGTPASQIVYTPSSTHEHDVFANDHSEGSFENEDESSRSPFSDSIFSSTTDSSFLVVSYPDSDETPRAGQPVSPMNTRPQFSTSGTSAHPSRASPVANPLTPNHTTPSQWTLAAPDGVMSNHNNESSSGSIGDADAYALGSSAFDAHGHPDLRYDLMPDLALPQHGATNDYRNITHSTFRTFEDSAQQMFHDFAYTTGTPFTPAAAPPSQQLREQQHYFANQYPHSQSLFQQQSLQHAPATAGEYSAPTLPATSSLMVHQSATAGMMQSGNVPIRSQPTRIVVHQPQSSTPAIAAPYPRPHRKSTSQVVTFPYATHRRAPHYTGPSNSSAAPSRRANIAPKDEPRPLIVPSNAPAPQAGANRKGGRARHTHLSDDKRQRISKMRGINACWRCVMQRDQCDEGPICRRCNIRSQRGQRDLFGCDRSKLTEWIDFFLPLSMTEMHSRPSIEKYVVDSVTKWNTSNSIDIYLTSGYGPPLKWRCCEFQPKDQELLVQLQYLQNPNTGAEERRLKYSPPFALEKLDESDDEHFQEYLNELMRPTTLHSLGWTFYEEECIMDPGYFQAQVLELMCTLFSETREPQLRENLHDVLRMLIVTYIMSHTLTIAQETLQTVLASVRYTQKQTTAQKHTSPRLANRQLKHYFSSLRQSVIFKILHRQQQTFHASKYKEANWLVSFCAMLGFAMVLEEIQRTIQIQADAKYAKFEMTEKDANAEAVRHCQAIDEKFEMMAILFQHKYRDKKWGEDGSFGPGTPNYRTLPETKFLRCLYELLVQRQDHLRSRRSVPLGPDHQCKYTTRLVARFLLPFLGLAT